MKIYLAGQCPYPEALAHARATMGRFLISYHYCKKTPVRTLRADWAGQDILLDSGGFSVRKKGQSIAVRDYLAFLSAMRGSFTACLNLDTKDANESQRNQTLLETSGITPLPVYHYSDWRSREHRCLLDHFIERYDYISLGGMAEGKLSRDLQADFLKYCFNRIPKHIKVHGLGITSMKTMMYFPFYSVDSKTWLVSGLYGDYITTKNARYKRTAKKRGTLSHYGILLPGPEKMKRAVDAFASLERQLTANWAKRGYVWNS